MPLCAGDRGIFIILERKRVSVPPCPTPNLKHKMPGRVSLPPHSYWQHTTKRLDTH